MNDLISIIVLVYKVEKYLDQCIQSILSQTYKNLEIILVCKNSEDNCAKICDRYANQDSRIKVIHQKDSGVDAARKLGIRNANGKYVGYVDGDDWIEPYMYEKLYEYASYHDVDVVESGIIDMWENEEKTRVSYFKEGSYKGERFKELMESRLLYSGKFFQHGISGYMWSKLFLKNSIEKFQLIPDSLNKYIDDTMVSLPCIAQTKSVYITHDCYYHYRNHSENGKCEVRIDEGIKFAQCYTEIFERFKGTKLCRKGDKQILSFMMYWLLLRAPGVFDSPDNTIFLTPFGGIKRRSKVVLYGAGMAGKFMEQYIQSVQECKLVCWVDQHYDSIKGQDNICDPLKIAELNFDYIVISIMRANVVSEVKKYLNQIGVKQNKILWIDEYFINNPLLLLKNAKCSGKPIFNRLEEYYE